MPALHSRLLEIRSGHTRALIYPEQGFQLYAFDVGEGAEQKQLVFAGAGPGEPWDRRHGNPILFPSICESFVGTERGAWLHDGKPLLMPLHGWARDLYFYIEERDETSLTARMAKPHTFALAFPFELELILRYSVAPSRLSLHAEVHNTGRVAFPYALGFHPYLKAPLSPRGARATTRVPLPSGTRLATTDAWCTLHSQPFQAHRLRADDALLNEGIVLQGTGRQTLSLIDEVEQSEVRVSVAESPEPMPVWAAWCESPASPYVCLEPWTSGPNPLTQGDAITALPGAVHRYRMDISLH